MFVFLFAHISEIDDANVVLLKPADKLSVNNVLAFVEDTYSFENCINLFGGGHIGLVLTDIFVKHHLAHKRTHTNHKKFIKIALIDRHE